MPKLDEIEIRQVDTLKDFQQLAELQMEIWGFDPLDIAPADLLMLQRLLGGVVIAGFDRQGKTIAFCYSFYGLYNSRHIHWSHMLAVLPEYRGLGLGKLLKWKQRELILSQNVSICRWTFDPLEAVNCRLNIVTLGATTGEYEINVYGESSGPLHAGLPTDRFIAHWELDSARVNRAAAGEPMRIITPLKSLPVVLDIEWRENNPYPGEPKLGLQDAIIGCPIPPEIQRIKKNNLELAKQWRMVTREVFQSYFSRDYRVVDVLTPEEYGQPLFVYVLARTD